MKITLLSAFAVLTLITSAAHAETEGNGDPFPFRAPGVVVAAGLANPVFVASAQAGSPQFSRSGAEIAKAPAPSRQR